MLQESKEKREKWKEKKKERDRERKKGRGAPGARRELHKVLAKQWRSWRSTASVVNAAELSACLGSLVHELSRG